VSGRTLNRLWRKGNEGLFLYFKKFHFMSKIQGSIALKNSQKIPGAVIAAFKHRGELKGRTFHPQRSFS
jgi:hypothetical protein